MGSWRVRHAHARVRNLSCKATRTSRGTAHRARRGAQTRSVERVDEELQPVVLVLVLIRALAPAAQRPAGTTRTAGAAAAAAAAPAMTAPTIAPAVGNPAADTTRAQQLV